MKEICDKLGLLQNNSGIIRVPFLIKGKLSVPDNIDRDQIETAFNDVSSGANYINMPWAQVIREPVIDQRNMRYSGGYIYQVLPPINSRELIETDIEKMANGLYELSVDDILDYLNSISIMLNKNKRLVARVLEIYRLTTEYPYVFVDKWFAALKTMLDRQAAMTMIDNELSLWGQPGSKFLNNWVEINSPVIPGLTVSLARGIFLKEIIDSQHPVKTLIRAMPTRQLHITAGNSPEVPIVSALRAILTKSASVIKLPFGAVLAGSLFGLAANIARPDHPLTQNMSIVYWQGGDEKVENTFFLPNSFDRIVVWGSPETVATIQSRALFTKIVCLNPRYGVSLIGKEAFDHDLEDVVIKSSVDTLIANQKACTASLIHYVEGTKTQVDRYAELLCKAFTKWDSSVPQFIPPVTIGQLKRLRLGKYVSAKWYVNSRDGEFTSGVLVVPDEFNVLDHPMCRLVIVHPVSDLKNSLKYLNQNVSTVGIYPEEKRTAFRNLILARGVSNVFPLGQCERIFAGMPHDGMSVLSQLVDWKNA